ncbi:MAG: type II secretion system protein GspL [Colwellia sp.]|jgi:general secretion pathway protein L|nr:MAG: type II secretion system protein GspL [Colwellia sp.]
MAEILYIRLGSRVQDKISWLIFSTSEQEIIASGELTSAEQLSELTEKARQRDVKVFVPGGDVLLKSLTVPTKSQRAMRSAVPYMLEDELAQDVDQLFFAYANITDEQSDNNCFVAVTERAQMLLWLSWLAEANIQTKTLQPDVLAMPYTAGQWHAIALNLATSSSCGASNGIQIVVRQGQWQGFTLDSDAWQFSLQHVFATEQKEGLAQEKNDIIINTYSDLGNFNEASSPKGFTIVKAEEELPLALFAQHCQHSKFNLLQGEFKVIEHRSKNMKNWLWAAGIAVCALLLNVSYKNVQLWQLSAQQEQVEKQIIARYKTVFPNTKKVRIGTIKSQLNRKIAQLGGVTEQTGFLSMLSQIQPAFAKVPELTPESIKFDGKRQELRLQAIAGDYQHFERFKTALSTANLTVKLGAQNSLGKQVIGSFIIVSKQKSTNSKGGS